MALVLSRSAYCAAERFVRVLVDLLPGKAHRGQPAWSGRQQARSLVIEPISTVPRRLFQFRPSASVGVLSSYRELESAVTIIDAMRWSRYSSPLVFGGNGRVTVASGASASTSGRRGPHTDFHHRRSQTPAPRYPTAHPPSQLVLQRPKTVTRPRSTSVAQATIRR